MTDNKYTDEDIISSLKIIATTGNCNECKIRNCKWGTCNCSQITANAALDLFTRQQAKIDEFMKETAVTTLIDDAVVYTPTLEDYNKFKQKFKSEAYKEFAEESKGRLSTCVTDTQQMMIELRIDNPLEEKVGKNND